MTQSDNNNPVPAVPKNTLSILQEAIKSVPATKYALAIAGIAAAASIVRLVVSGNWAHSVAVVLTMFVLMVGMALFASIAKTPSKLIRLPMMAMMWSFTTLFILGGALSMSSVFFSWPLSLGNPPAPNDPMPSLSEREVTAREWGNANCGPGTTATPFTSYASSGGTITDGKAGLQCKRPDGKSHGPVVMYWNGNQKRQALAGQSDNDSSEGIWRAWDQHGELEWVKCYVNNKAVWERKSEDGIALPQCPPKPKVGTDVP